jgi:hypothetical protein
MWLGLVFLFIIIIAALGSIFAGGIWTIVVVPVALLIVVFAGLIVLWRRSQDPAARKRPAGSVGTPPSVNVSTGSGVNDPVAPDTPDEALDRRRSA